MRLRDFSSWPSVWECRGASSPSADDISRDGVFIGARLVTSGLNLAAQYKGEYCTANFAPSGDANMLRSLRDQLRSFKGRPMRDVEDLEVNTASYRKAQ
jgi:hypothetical protein